MALILCFHILKLAQTRVLCFDGLPALLLDGLVVHGIRQNLAFMVWGLGFRVRGFRVYGLGFRVQGFGFRVEGPGRRVQGSRLRVQGLGFRV